MKTKERKSVAILTKKDNFLFAKFFLYCGEQQIEQ